MAAVDDSYSKALLHLNGTDASTTITDESGTSWTANGNAQIDTNNSKFGNSSGLFDGNDALSSVDSDDWYFGTGDFTIDFWVYFNSLPTNGYQTMFICQKVSSSDRFFFDLDNYSNNIYLAFTVDSTNISGVQSCLHRHICTTKFLNTALPSVV